MFVCHLVEIRINYKTILIINPDVYAEQHE